MKKFIKMSFLCLMFLVFFYGLEANAQTQPEGYGATITKYEITSTKKALKKYKQKKAYYIKATSTPLSKSGFSRYSTYNKKTKNYYTIRSYMEEFERAGGGTLVLKKGTYKLTNTVFVPNNVTIIFEDGVKLQKTMKTGVKSMNAATSMFQLITPKKAGKTKAVKKYNGTKNVNFIGVGTVTIDLKNVEKSIAIICGHNKNLTIRGLTFKNMNNGHFIEMDATDTALVDHCIFTQAKENSDYVKEAINLDTPDKNTKGFSSKWTSFDKTPNKNVTISNCTFSKMGRAIGTHKYSAKGKKQMMHTGLRIVNNVITEMYNDALRVMNWKDCVISNNTITNVWHNGDPNEGTARAILFSGTDNVTVTKNYISGTGRAFQYMAWKNSGPGANYPVIIDNLTEENKAALSDNWVENLSTEEWFTRITRTYNVYTNAEKVYFTVNVPEEPDEDLTEDMVDESIDAPENW